jgi:hypothetical protein
LVSKAVLNSPPAKVKTVFVQVKPLLPAQRPQPCTDERTIKMIMIIGGDSFCGRSTALHLSAQGHPVNNLNNLDNLDNLSRRTIDTYANNCVYSVN